MAKELVYMLTTVDNPYNPITDFDNWYMFDMDHGYDCCGRLARSMTDSQLMSEDEEERDKEKAIDRIIKYDPTNMYRKAFAVIDKVKT